MHEPPLESIVVQKQSVSQPVPLAQAGPAFSGRPRWGGCLVSPMGSRPPPGSRWGKGPREEALGPQGRQGSFPGKQLQRAPVPSLQWPGRVAQECCSSNFSYGLRKQRSGFGIPSSLFSFLWRLIKAAVVTPILLIL